MRSWGWIAATIVALALVAGVLSYNKFGHLRSLPVGQPEASAPAQIVRIGTFSTGIDYAPFYVARSKGWLEEAVKRHGARIEYTDFEALPAINDALASRRLDVILQADTPAIIQEASGNNILEIAPLASLDRQLVVSNKSKINSLQDLRGKTIGVLFGTGFHYGLVDALSRAGVKPGTYRVLNLAPPEAQAALAAGTIDAWAVWPPFPQSAALNRSGRLISLGTGHVISMVLASEDFFHANKALTDDLAAAIRRGQDFIKSSPDEAQKLVATETKLSPEVVAMAWKTMDFTFKFDSAAVGDIEAQAKFLHDGKYVNREVDVSKELFADEAASK